MWVWVLDPYRLEYICGSQEWIDPWGQRMNCGWSAPRTLYFRRQRREQ